MYIFNKNPSKRFYKIFYYILAKNIIEIILIYNKKELIKNIYSIDISYIEKYLKKNPIIITIHFNNWEIMGINIDISKVVIYKKLSNPYTENLLKNIREKLYEIPIEMKNILNNLDIIKKYPTIFLIDQNLRTGSIYKFLNKKTLISDFPLKLAKKQKRDILYCVLIKENGQWKIKFKYIYYNEFKEKEIEKIFMEILEFFSYFIYMKPTRWFGFTHKIWKNTKELQPNLY